MKVILLGLVTRTKPMVDQHDITGDEMSGAVWNQALTNISLSWDIFLGKMFTILNDQGSVMITLTKGKGGLGLKYSHRK